MSNYMDGRRKKEQAKEILENNGRCPDETMCSGCIIKEIGNISQCCSDYAINLCKKFLGIETNENKTECECKNWANDGRLPLLNHHPRCQHYSPISEMTVLIKDLLIGIEKWGSEEDGIPDEIYDAYTKAKMAMGQLDFLNKN